MRLGPGIQVRPGRDQASGDIQPVAKRRVQRCNSSLLVESVDLGAGLAQRISDLDIRSDRERRLNVRIGPGSQQDSNDLGVAVHRRVCQSRVSIKLVTGIDVDSAFDRRANLLEIAGFDRRQKRFERGVALAPFSPDQPELLPCRGQSLLPGERGKVFGYIPVSPDHGSQQGRDRPPMIAIRPGALRLGVTIGAGFDEGASHVEQAGARRFRQEGDAIRIDKVGIGPVLNQRPDVDRATKRDCLAQPIGQNGGRSREFVGRS